MAKQVFFGGSFDPFHLGHEAIIKSVIHFYQEDIQIVIVPTAVHSQKSAFRLSSFQRIALLERAVSKYAQLSLNLIEYQLPKPSYTYNTLVRLSKPGDVILLGRDQLDNFSTWYCFEKILERVSLLVASRDTLFSEQEKQQYQILYPKAKIEFLDNDIVKIASSQFANFPLEIWQPYLPATLYSQCLEWQHEAL